MHRYYLSTKVNHVSTINIHNYNTVVHKCMSVFRFLGEVLCCDLFNNIIVLQIIHYKIVIVMIIL